MAYGTYLLDRHMTEAHSFFIPDPEFLGDLAGLIEYLGAKVGCSFLDLPIFETTFLVPYMRRL
jgi:hypothetical protein